MLANILRGGSRSPGDTALFCAVLDPYFNNPPHDMRRFTISTLGSTSIWAPIKQAHTMTGNGDGDISMFFCYGLGATYHNQHGYISFLNGSDYSTFGTIGSMSYSATSNGSGDIAAFVTQTKAIEYYNISSANSATTPENIPGSYIGAMTSNGLGDRGFMASAGQYMAGGTGGAGMNQSSYFTFSTRSTSNYFGDDIYLNPTPAMLSNDIYNRAVWANGICGELCGVNHIRYVNILSLGSCTRFGANSYASWSAAATSNGINNMGVFFGGNAVDYPVKFRSYINISTPSNATEASNLEILCSTSLGACSNAKL